MTGISLAVTLVADGLPAVVTLRVDLGIRAMVRRKALLRRLQAPEGHGVAKVICADITGTRTENQMIVQPIWFPAGSVDMTGTGYHPAGCFEMNGQSSNHHDRSNLLRL